MAQRRKKNTKHNSTRRICMNLIWIAIFAVAIFAFANKSQDSEFHNSKSSNSKTENLQEIIVDHSISNIKHDYLAFSVYFNPDLHIPNAVVYELTATETIGKEKRFNNFEHDPKVAGCAFPWDYTNSGYDRGHMAPAADMKWNLQAMRESFYMTNVCPQNRSLNSGAWHKLEKKVREWAERDGALIVITGPIVSSKNETIGKETHVTVPTAFFKVILAHNVQPMRAIAFVYPNERSKGGLREHVKSVDEVEILTGLDFFASLPDDIENKIESRCNLDEWTEVK